jgi:mRNA interferase MazF
MLIKQYQVWIADLNPRIGTEAGKTRPVIVLQTDLLNRISHPSTIICPLTSRVQMKANVLRVHLKKGMANLQEDCDVLIDQVRAIDNRRLIKLIGNLPVSSIEEIKANLKIVLDIDIVQ